ncbi:hypothetical protein BDZ91DRAFT_405303 [Kalaharituber pfeilii]|nr:hypothetical protein BDZ91DRAFT_405303 [Kalaharituber pfeilii]
MLCSCLCIVFLGRWACPVYKGPIGLNVILSSCLNRLGWFVTVSAAHIVLSINRPVCFLIFLPSFAALRCRRHSPPPPNRWRRRGLYGVLGRLETDSEGSLRNVIPVTEHEKEEF